MWNIKRYTDRFTDTRKLTVRLTFILIGVLILFPAAKADARVTEVSCRNNALCQSIEGKDFNMILFSEFGSALAIIYDKSTVGDINIAISGSPYREEMGTVIDAIRFLTGISEYRTFTVSRAIKSVGWFGYERIDGMYIVRPVYDATYESRAAKYVITGRDGEIELRITPVYSFETD